LKETVLAFKEYDLKPTFLDMEIQRGFENSRNRQILPEIDEIIHWGSGLFAAQRPTGERDLNEYEMNNAKNEFSHIAIKIMGSIKKSRSKDNW
jgi:hypothetical protein